MTTYTIFVTAGTIKAARSAAARELGISNRRNAAQPICNRGEEGAWRLSWPDGNDAEIQIKPRTPTNVFGILHHQEEV